MLSSLDQAELTPLLPASAGEPLGLIAGGGALPRMVAAKAREAGWAPVIIPVGDGWNDNWAGFPTRPMKWSQTGDIFAVMRGFDIRHVIMCGTISVRPDYRSMLPSLRTLMFLPEIFSIVRGGDDSLLRAVSRAFEKRGFSMHSVQEILPEVLTPEGLITGKQPGELAERALMRAAQAAISLGALDIGQAAVASPDRVIALEGIEGTREMLKRVADLRNRGKIGRSEPCVLFKSVKPQQDLRFDLPSIGVETIAQAAECGLKGIGLTAGHSLVIDAQSVVEAAQAQDIFIVGINRTQIQD
ncbi:DUF1009 domain-containing protein [Aureimonas fodinaquatilis]|uniref:DUF1009 domain-containing protein n=1 Tax=Aureimonas fodinaquatilis TaxID=2565783 RepID=A0A5B0DZ60_9HYPH|nr:UDP-2,3-diacylglucosamine diphosphatase LpxI [Aureimonas fodinaquatilis]KAA0970489.1 DUF1009 domain-containing protein [Aureimonas fodinaquatilis]